MYLLAFTSGISMFLTKRFPSTALEKNSGFQNTVIAGCHNKHDTLRLALASWTAAENVQKIVLVDWGSDPAYFAYLPVHPNVMLIRVENASRYILTSALNLASRYAEKTDGLLKLDCDTIITSDFLAQHPLEPMTYYAGDWRVATDENQVHLNGIFYARAVDFKAIGGYDERIHGYGWDDTDLYMRFNSSGLMLKHLDYTRITHLYHDSGDRQRDVPTLTGCVEFETALNQLLLQSLPAWNASMEPAEFSAVEPAGSTKASAMHLVHLPRNLREITSAAHFEKSVRTAASAFFNNHVEGYRWHAAMDELPSSYLVQLVGSVCQAKKNSSAKRMLIVHLQHGLGNRLRALASAALLARKRGMWLRIISPVDIHFNTTLENVINATASGLFDIWPDFNPVELDLSDFDVYDYMDLAHKYEQIKSGPNHIYVRSAYRLNSTISTMEEEDAVLRSLVPHAAVMELVDSIPLDGGKPIVGVHIRNLDPRTELPDLQQSEYPDEGWAAIMYHRNSIKVEVFIGEMQRLHAVDPTTQFYVSADSVNVLKQVVANAAGVRVHSLDLINAGCSDRATACLQLAYANLLLLGRSNKLLGSYWSAYSEIAGCIAGVAPRYAGHDF